MSSDIEDVPALSSLRDAFLSLRVVEFRGDWVDRLFPRSAARLRASTSDPANGGVGVGDFVGGRTGGGRFFLKCRFFKQGFLKASSTVGDAASVVVVKKEEETAVRDEEGPSATRCLLFGCPALNGSPSEAVLSSAKGEVGARKTEALCICPTEALVCIRLLEELAIATVDLDVGMLSVAIIFLFRSRRPAIAGIVDIRGGE